MLIRELLRPGKTTVSFEFFPPNTPRGWDRLFSVIADLVPLKPSYVSVTYGAGGRTRENTHDLITRLRKETNLEIVAHLTCVGHTRDEIAAILDRYADEGIRNVLALRGDDPTEGAPEPSDGGFPYAADLVAMIRETHPEMGIGVAGFVEGHPDSANRLEEITHLKAKVDAGADYIVTQLFFDNRDYYDFVDRCRLDGIDVPVIAGVMPVTGLRNMERMAELSPRARFPAGLLRTIRRGTGKEQVERAGTHWATEQVRDLIDRGVPGIHLYTLNHSRSTIRIGEALGLDGFGTLE